MLPRLTSREHERRRRAAAAAERVAAWGPRLRSALPAALAGLWPFARPDAWQLRVTLEQADGSERELALDAFPLRIGRGGSCALQLADPAVSSEHAELQLEGGRAYVMDLRSTNGTRLNGEPLVPLTPMALVVGDRLELGPFALAVRSLSHPGEGDGRIEFTACAPRERAGAEALVGASPAERWVRLRCDGETVLVKVGAAWMRAAWGRVGDATDAAPGLSALEEGAAQFLLAEVTRALGERLGAPVELGGWLSAAEASGLVEDEPLWLEYEVWLRAAATAAPLTLLVPAGEPGPPGAEATAWAALEWPASLGLGQLSLAIGAWRGVEPGDALVPDRWWAGAAAPSEWTSAWIRVGGTFHGVRFVRSPSGVKLRLESPWRSLAGGETQVSDEDVRPPEPLALGVQDLELLVSVELDRFPVTLAELQRWRAGELVTLRRAPSENVSLVIETGAQRRVLAEGRVVVVDGRLAVEVVRLLTRLEDAPGQS